MALAPNDIMDARKLSFRCPKCHALAVYWIGVGGSLVPAGPVKAVVTTQVRAR